MKLHLCPCVVFLSLWIPLPLSSLRSSGAIAGIVVLVVVVVIVLIAAAVVTILLCWHFNDRLRKMVRERGGGMAMFTEQGARAILHI